MTKTEPVASPFLSALMGVRPARRPVWIMRQAGRYLPEYRALRARYSFLTVCRTPELACEATLQPIRRFGFDAAILFSDILVPLEPMGAAFTIGESGPRLERPVRDEAAVDALRVVDSREALPFVAEAVRLACSALGSVPLIGFAGAPFTLAAYLVEGKGSKNWQHLKTMLYRRPDLLQALLRKLEDQVVDFLEMQVEAGVRAVQLFDTWAGILAPEDHARFVLPGLRRIFRRLEGEGVPRVLFMKGAAPVLEDLARSGADALSLDWTLDLGAAIERLPGLAVQGNLDPTALFGPPEEIRRRVRAVCRKGDRAPGHVFNLGHGILPDTPIASVEAVVDAVRDHRAEAAA